MSVLSDWIPFFWVIVKSPANNVANITDGRNRLSTPLLSSAISDFVDTLASDLIMLYQRQKILAFN